MVLTMGLTVLVDFREPVQSRRPRTCGRSCCMTSSGNDDFLRRRVAFRSTASVGFLGNLL
jgi:hypothetical protein